MVRDYPGEIWKKVKFNFPHTNSGIIEVSNFGRIKTSNKVHTDHLVKGSMINGYKILRLKLYTPREENIQARFDQKQQSVFRLARKIKALKENKALKSEIKEQEAVLIEMKTKLSQQFQKDLKQRTINYHSLFHRLVADMFLPKPTRAQEIVAHLDYDKLNNKASNLKWMTKEENYAHQQYSPYVIKEKKERKTRRKESSKATKLTVTKVMLLKKLLEQGKPMKSLVRQFKITDTQILRIKRGENWGDIPAAK